MRYAFILIPILLILSCSKKETDGPLPPVNTWQVSDRTFKKQVSRWQEKDSLHTIEFGDDGVYTNMLRITFTQKPEGGGKKYRIVYEPRNENEVAIEEWQQNHGHSGSQDDAAQYLRVSGVPGALTFTVSKVELEHYTFVVNYNVDCSINLSE